MESTKYIGMDVHKDAISVAVMNSARKMVMESVLETKAATILQFIRGLRGNLLVTLAGAPARARRRRVGTGRGYRPIVIGLKQPTSPERHKDNVHEADSA